ncbi:MAG: tetratricopeptide repeat protein [Isosphaeraceae bacterium]
MLDDAAQQEDYEAAQEALDDDDLDTVRACLKRMLRRAPDDVRSIEISGDLARTRGEYARAEKLYRKMTDVSDDTAVRGLSCLSIGLVLRDQDDKERARPMLRQAADIFRQVGDTDRLLLALSMLGDVCRDLGALRDGAAAYHEGLNAIAANEDDPESDWPGRFALDLGYVYRLLGELDRGLIYLDQARHRFRSLGRDAELADVLDAMGCIKQVQGAYDEAEALHAESVAINEGIENPEGLSTNYGNLSLLCQNREQWDEAEEYLNLAYEIDKVMDRKDGIADYHMQLGTIRRERGEYESAESSLLKGLKLQKKQGTAEGVAVSYSQLGVLYRLQERFEEAEAMTRKGLEMAEEMGHGDALASLLDELAQLRKDQGRPDEARDLWTRSLALFESLRSARMIGEVRGRLASLDQESPPA